MNRNTMIPVLIGLAIALVLVLLIAPHASSDPDGLEKVAGDQGFLGTAESAPAWSGSPLPDYEVPGVKGEISTGLAGVLGTLATFAVAYGAASLMGLRTKKEKKEKQA